MARSPVAENLVNQLARGPAGAPELVRALGISQPTLSRAIAAMQREGRVIRIGTTRGARYGLSRPVGTIGSRWPLFRVDENGRLIELGPLHALERNLYYLPRGAGRLRGITEGIPYFLQDARPSGFLGRAIPRAFTELALPPRIIDWTDEHFLSYLTLRAPDNVGDLILGEGSVERYMARSHESQVVSASERPSRYAVMAASAMEGAPAGSSAQGEQPKFLVQVDEARRRTHMLVKFSPPRTSEAGQRWVDLLLAEHLAHELLARAGLPSCRSSWFLFGERAYLEVVRFDRRGMEGRRGAVSLYAVDLARYGRLDTWSECARRLEAEGLLSTEDSARIRLLDVFAQLIANSDRHFGNITLFDHYEGPFELAPVYDMLPMLFAPQHDQVIERRYEPAPPNAASLPVWSRARTLAEEYWALLADDTRLSRPFRSLCARCLEALRALSVRGLN
ncbi:MAG TPA: type II toxin-antitoxin system HipA family toxin YjjJ [Steroidobacteraceae bacterium]|nr:type II toxin-antitoxin system HipA family toxin YjjJ [Steroidobacteraceae bacterium]